MIVSGSRLRQIGWVAVLALCIGLFLVLSFRVHAVKSAVLLAERQIVELERETLVLETEFQARASQRQLANWNVVEFGYVAPRADQYLQSERQLASLGSPQVPGAPRPIRVAVAQAADGSTPASIRQREMVSPISGAPVTLASAQSDAAPTTMFAEALGDFLIEASPIRAAQARTGGASSSLVASQSAEAAE
ncbi:MAG: hypothetical protein AAGL68_07605 [Pseudomonadota bacterium]